MFPYLINRIKILFPVFPASFSAKKEGKFQRKACVEIARGFVGQQNKREENSLSKIPMLRGYRCRSWKQEAQICICPQPDITIHLTSRKCRLFPASMGRDRKDSIV